MTRFLIRPPVHCANLASQVLSLCMRRVAQDYRTRYGVEPWLVESFVDGSRYTGRCYQAANWIPIGVTTGRGRSGPGKPTTTRKLLYLYELNRRWRADMGLPSAHQSVAPLNVEHGLGEEAWVAAEFGGVKFGHEVSERRLLRIAVAKARNPSASYPECVAGDRHQLKAYYRFIGSRRETVDPAGILAGHRRRTIARMKGQSRVLMIQDSTDLDFSSRLRCNGLGVVGKNQTGAVSQGLKMHSSLAVSDTGLPLGVLQLHLYAPKAGEPEKRAGRPIETKESFRWLRGVQDLREISAWVPQTELIAVGDRESDLFELFDYRRRQARNIHLLVRANHNRCLQQGSAKLFEHLGSMPAMAQARIQVPRQRATKGKPTKPARIALPARIARVTLRWSAVTLAAPDYGRLRRVRPVELYALLVREPHPPKGAKSLHWVLLTTIPIRSRKQALRTLRWYTLRWRIEEWHRVLKSGCRIESHQHHSAERLARAIAIDAVIGWRLMLLTLLARETPHAPATLVFPKWECRLLELLQPLVAPRRSGGRKRGLSKSQQPV
jgi:hypothetical protein